MTEGEAACALLMACLEQRDIDDDPARRAILGAVPSGCLVAWSDGRTDGVSTLREMIARAEDRRQFGEVGR